MSNLKKNFNYKVKQQSPVIGDDERVVKYDEDGKEFVTYVPVDYKKIIASHGSVDDWSLNALLKAGINPNFPIKTGLNTRIEGAAQVDAAVAELDRIIAEDTAAVE